MGRALSLVFNCKLRGHICIHHKSFFLMHVLPVFQMNVVSEIVKVELQENVNERFDIGFVGCRASLMFGSHPFLAPALYLTDRYDCGIDICICCHCQEDSEFPKNLTLA